MCVCVWGGGGGGGGEGGGWGYPMKDIYMKRKLSSAYFSPKQVLRYQNHAFFHRKTDKKQHKHSYPCAVRV